MIFDADQHLYEEPDMYERYCDPSKRHYALRIEPDHLGYWWAVMPWQGDIRCNYAFIGTPGNLDPIAKHSKVDRANGVPSSVNYATDLPLAYHDPTARVRKLDEFGIDKTMLLPQLGAIWLQRGGKNLAAVRANLEAWNRRVVEVQQEGQGRLYPAGQITLRGGDQSWAIDQLTKLAEGGVRSCMVPHTLADGRRLSHEDHERTWSAFEDLGIVPVMHVMDGEERLSGFAHEWFENDRDPIIPMLELSFSWTGIHMAMCDMVRNGVFERHPRMRVLVVEMGMHWYPKLLGLDMMWGSHSGLPALERCPSEYVIENIALAPGPPPEPGLDTFLQEQGAGRFMFSSDWGHCEGLADPVGGFRQIAGDLPAEDEERLYGGNLADLLGVAGSAPFTFRSTTV